MPANSKASKPIVVIGSINYDILLHQDKLPAVGETVLIENIHMCGGGKGANQAVQVAKLGHPVILIAAVGNDVFGDLLLEELSVHGIDTSYLMRKGSNSGLGIVNYISSGALLSNVYSGANSQIFPTDLNPFRDIIKNATLVILQTEIPVETVEYSIRLAHEYNVKIVYNAAPVRELHADVLGMVDYLIINEAEASFYFGAEVNSPERAIKLGIEFHKKYNHQIVVTLGPKGSVFIGNEQSFYIESIDVPVVETTGAGDSFVGAFAKKISEGSDMLVACRFATAASSITIQKPGGQSSMPTLQEVIKLYNSTYGCYK
jgi:ribokinase